MRRREVIAGLAWTLSAGFAFGQMPARRPRVVTFWATTALAAAPYIKEFEEGLKCIGAPIRDRTGSVVAAVSIAGPAMRLKIERMPRLIESVVEAAAKPFGSIDQLIVLNGAEGISEALAQAVSQGAAGLQVAGKLLSRQPENGRNGTSRRKGARQPAEEAISES